MSQHAIHRQLVEVRIPDESDALRWLRDLETWTERTWLPALEQMLDAHDTPGHVFEIDRLELGPYTLRGEDWRSELVRRVRSDLEREFTLRIGPRRAPGHGPGDPEAAGVPVRPSPQSDSLVPLAEHDARIWRRYLLDGMVSPAVAPSDFRAAMSRLANQVDVGEAPSPRLASELLEKAHPEVFRRLWSLLSETQRARVADRGSADRDRWGRDWQTALETAPGFVRAAAAALIPILVHSATQGAGDAGLARRTAARLGRATALRNPTSEDAAATEPRMLPDAREGAASDPAAFDRSARDLATEPERDPVFYTRSAGSVLLHPFLPDLFERLGFLRDGRFADDEARSAAAAALAYAVWALEAPADPFLTLEKLLCGLPIAHPVTDPLPREHRAAVDSTLRRAIAEWGALGNTSPDGLREGFLRREGRLERRADRWQLLVDPRPIDVLLTRMPWGFGVIALRWMRERIQVDWA